MCRSLKYWATVHSTVCPLSCCSGNLGDKEEPWGWQRRPPAWGCAPQGHAWVTQPGPRPGANNTRPLGHLDRPRPRLPRSPQLGNACEPAMQGCHPHTRPQGRGGLANEAQPRGNGPASEAGPWPRAPGAGRTCTSRVCAGTLATIWVGRGRGGARGGAGAGPVPHILWVRRPCGGVEGAHLLLLPRTGPTLWPGSHSRALDPAGK